MKFSIWPGTAAPHRYIVELAQHAEQSGWDGVWVADHFMPNREDDNTGPTAEAWTTLAALAAVVPRVRLGTLVTGNTYRHPAVLAKQAAQVDIISEGRLVLGPRRRLAGERAQRLRHRVLDGRRTPAPP